MTKKNVLKNTTVKVAAAVMSATIILSNPSIVYAAADGTVTTEQTTDVAIPVNAGLTKAVIGQLGPFNVDGTYVTVSDPAGNPPAVVANSNGTIVVAMYQGTTISLNYQEVGAAVPAFGVSQNGFVQGNPASNGIALTGIKSGVDAVAFNVYSDAAHTTLLSQFVILVNVLPAQGTTATTTTTVTEEVLTPAQASQYMLQLVNAERAKTGLAPLTYKSDIEADLYEGIVSFANTCGSKESQNAYAGIDYGCYSYAKQYYGSTLTKSVVQRMFNSAMRDTTTMRNIICNTDVLYFGAAFYNNGKGWYDIIASCFEDRYWTHEQEWDFYDISDDEFWSIFE